MLTGDSPSTSPRRGEAEEIPSTLRDQARYSVSAETVGSPAGIELGGHNVRFWGEQGLCEGSVLRVFGVAQAYIGTRTVCARLTESSPDYLWSLTSWCLELGVCLGTRTGAAQLRTLRGLRWHSTW